jgi:hypothetical protein
MLLVFLILLPSKFLIKIEIYSLQLVCLLYAQLNLYLIYSHFAHVHLHCASYSKCYAV